MWSFFLTHKPFGLFWGGNFRSAGFLLSVEKRSGVMSLFPAYTHTILSVYFHLSVWIFARTLGLFHVLCCVMFI